MANKIVSLGHLLLMYPKKALAISQNMREDLENAGPVSETIKRNQLSGAQMAMFAASDMRFGGCI